MITYLDQENGTPTFTVHNAITPEFAKGLIDEFKDKTQIATHESKGEQTTEPTSWRDSTVSWFHNPDLYEQVYGFMQVANYHMGLRYKISGAEAFQFTKYTKDQHYDWHRDGYSDHFAARDFSFEPPKNLTQTGFPHLVGTCRKIICSLLLNDDYEGGGLEFMWIDEGKVKTKTIEPKPLDLIIFPSGLEHRVVPVTKGTRYSVVIWYGGPPLV